MPMDTSNVRRKRNSPTMLARCEFTNCRKSTTRLAQKNESSYRTICLDWRSWRAPISRARSVFNMSKQRIEIHYFSISCGVGLWLANNYRIGFPSFKWLFEGKGIQNFNVQLFSTEDEDFQKSSSDDSRFSSIFTSLLQREWRHFHWTERPTRFQNFLRLAEFSLDKTIFGSEFFSSRNYFDGILVWKFLTRVWTFWWLHPITGWSFLV